MFNNLSTMTKAVTKSVMVLFSFSLIAMATHSASAQTQLSNQYPELDKLFKAFDVTHGALLERVVSINEDPSTQMARNELEEHLKMQASM